jgi:uncharacterized protein YndB with AHSA1/START domain
MRAVSLTRIVPAPRDKVWVALTDSDELARWFWPQRLAPVCTVDLREGGSWRIISDALGIRASGDYLGVEPMKRLDYTWRWNDEDEETHVTVTLDDAAMANNPATTVTVLHLGFRTDEALEEHEVGWNDSLDRLPESLAV